MAGRPSTSSRNVKMFNLEAMLLMPLVPYMLMILGTFGALGIGWALRFWIRDRLGLQALMALVVFLSMAMLAVVGFKLFIGLTTRTGGMGWYLSHHVVYTVIVGHLTVWMFMLFGSHEWTWAMWGIGSFFTIISWLLRRLARNSTLTLGQDEGASVGLPGSSYLGSYGGGSDSMFNVERTTVKLGPRLTTADAVNARDLIAADKGLPLRAVRVEPHPTGNRKLAVIAVTRTDPFKQRVLWTPSPPGGSCTERLDFATAEDGQRVGLWLPGDDERNAQHYLCAGVAGSGKSKCWQAIYGELMGRTEVIVVFADAVKWLQTAGALAPGMAWLAVTDKQVQEVIRSIDRMIFLNVRRLAKLGLDEWKPGCGFPYVVYHIEESAGLANRGFIKLAERARSAGISIVLSQQRASGDRMNTSVRYNLGGAVCFGVRDIVDTHMVLRQSTIDHGAEPHEWGNTRRGQFYLEADGIHPSRYAIPNKVDWVDRERLKDAERAGRRYRAKVDDDTAVALGPEYAKYVQAVRVGESPWQNMGTTSLVKDDEQEALILVANNSSSSTVTTAEADAILSVYLSAHAEFTWAAISAELLPAVDRSPAWLKRRLNREITNGSLTSPQRGVYRAPSK